MTTPEPTLLFFRHRPEGWAANPYLASLPPVGRDQLLLDCSGPVSPRVDDLRIGS